MIGANHQLVRGAFSSHTYLRARITPLYAAGNCLGHRYGPGYSTPTAGTSMGMAFTHGRVPGKYLAAL